MGAGPLSRSSLWGALLLLAGGCRNDPTPFGGDKPSEVPSPGGLPAQPDSYPEPPKVGALPEAGARRRDLDRPNELGPVDPGLRFRPVTEQQVYLLRLLAAFEKPTPAVQERLRQIVLNSEWLSFGNPQIAKPALSQDQCRALWASAQPEPADSSCGHRNMVRASASVCIDQFEFPNVLCEYPVVWARASEAVALCSALGKRLCDAHEWEGACAGEVLDPKSEYAYERLPRGIGPEYRRARRILMEGWHNQSRPIIWAYGALKNHALCGTLSRKSASCTTVDYGICGTNDYPAGSFPLCHSTSGVYDQHGNVAEHMSLPLFPDELGGQGYTEMKGSWFLFDREETHPDDCRWRARNWHTTKVSDGNSHRNYHLGFRCCADLPPRQSP